MNTRKILKFSSIVLVLIIIVVAGFFIRQHRIAAAPLPERYGFRITCPVGTSTFERYDSLVCADGPDGMWEGEVDVAPTNSKSVHTIVDDNNRTLSLTDAAYMQIVRETSVDGEPAIVVKQTGGSEAGPSSPDLAQTMLVIHRGNLYQVLTRELQQDVAGFQSSFHFTK